MPEENQQQTSPPKSPGEYTRREIEKAINLPTSYAFSLCLQAIRTRLGRSIITGTGTILGIAFLVSVLTGGNVVENVSEAELDPVRVTQQNWLVVMSLLVSTVGIANSMLMSVTERFKEIGTMKCLGALDRLVVKLFLMESALLGFLGSVAGALIGLLFALIARLPEHGLAVFTRLDWGAALLHVGIAVLLGTLLSVVATLGPAWKAAKMPPAAAMRSEI